jgi:hypothetical protein
MFVPHWTEQRAETTARSQRIEVQTNSANIKASSMSVIQVGRVGLMSGCGEDDAVLSEAELV